MVVEYPFEQRSPEWFAVRKGKITASLFHSLMPSSRQKITDFTNTQLAILQDLASQILTGERHETFQSADMKWGVLQEDAARTHYSQIAGLSVRTCGMFENTALPGCGASPDGITTLHEGEPEAVAYFDGALNVDITAKPIKQALEIKCPLSKTHMKYLCDPSTLWDDYKWQVVGQVVITELDGGEIISFDPRFRDESKQLVRYIPEITEEDKQLLAARLAEAVMLIKEWTV